MTFGQQLKQEREARGISLDDVAVSTRISLKHLNALEADRFEELPGGVFNRGIVRSYAACCGMDTDAAVREFQIALDRSGYTTPPRDDDWREFAEAVQRSRKPAGGGNSVRWLGVVGMVLAVLVVAAGVLWVLVHRGAVHLPDKAHVPAIHRNR